LASNKILSGYVLPAVLVGLEMVSIKFQYFVVFIRVRTKESVYQFSEYISILNFWESYSTNIFILESNGRATGVLNIVPVVFSTEANA
jgi:hypothetical protein